MAPNEPQKLSISSVEGSRIVVTAMFNPKELTVDQPVPWTKQSASRTDPPSLQYSSADGRVMSFELTFDGLATGTNVYTAFIQNLEKLATVMDAAGPEDRKRPPMVGVKWGPNLPEFRGVIETLSTKYTMFLPDGTPVHATCRVTIREAAHLSVGKV